MKRTLSILIALVMVVSIFLAGCGQASEKVTVATDATWPPFESIDETTKDIIGFDIELMEAIAEEGGFEVEFVNVAWDPLLAGMAQCQYDLAISAMTITEERQKEFAFSDPYFAAGQIVAVQTSNTDITGPESLVGKVVGAQLGTTGAIEVESMEGVELKNYDDVALAFQDLMNGQIDAVVADNPLVLEYVRQNAGKIKSVGEAFTDESYGIAVCKTDTDLLKKVNKGLAAVMKTDLIDQLTQKWLIGQ